MTIADCLAAKHNPNTGCTDKCKWPNACGKTSITVVETTTVETPATPEAEVKPKRGRKPKGE